MGRSARPTILSTLRRLAADPRGTAALEFALILGVLVALVFGIVEFGRALAARNEMSHALSRVVRVLDLDATVTPSAIRARLESYLDDYEGTGLDVSIAEISGTSYMEISVTFPFEIVIPFSPVTELDLKIGTLAPRVRPVL